MVTAVSVSQGLSRHGGTVAGALQQCYSVQTSAELNLWRIQNYYRKASLLKQDSLEAGILKTKAKKKQNSQRVVQDTTIK